MPVKLPRPPMLSLSHPSTMPAGLTVKHLAAVSAVALVVAMARCADAATLVITAERRGDTIDIHASAQLRADADTAWRVLTAYDRYTDFIPDLRTSRIVARQDRTVTVEQSGDARVWRLPVPLDMTFEIVESPPAGLHSHAIAGTLRAMESSYSITRAEGGVGLDYVGHIAPGFELFGSLELDAVKQNVARQFQALADEIERQSTAVAADEHGR